MLHLDPSIIHPSGSTDGDVLVPGSTAIGEIRIER
jgi:hypothetical protein